MVVPVDTLPVDCDHVDMTHCVHHVITLPVCEDPVVVHLVVTGSSGGGVFSLLGGVHIFPSSILPSQLSSS
jgi:hypothetical protein